MLYLVHVSVDEQIVAGGECQLDIRVVVGRVLVWIVRVLGYEDLERHRLTAAIRRTTGGVLCQPRVNHLLQQTNRIAQSNQHDNFHHNLQTLTSTVSSCPVFGWLLLVVFFFIYSAVSLIFRSHSIDYFIFISRVLQSLQIPAAWLRHHPLRAVDSVLDSCVNDVVHGLSLATIAGR